MAESKLELYFYNECSASQSVLSTITNIGCRERIVFKNIRENPAFREELVTLTGTPTVPTLVIDGEPMRESTVINEYLVDQFLG